VADEARLVRLGFADAAGAAALLANPEIAGLVSADEFGIAADPDLALRSMVAMVERGLPTELLADGERRRRLLCVLGASEALGTHVAGHPNHIRVLDEIDPPEPGEVRRHLLMAIGADADSDAPVASSSTDSVPDDLRVAYRRELLGIAGRDLAGNADLGQVAAELAELADGVLEGALAVARAIVGPESALCRLAVIAMGKAGGRELNYVSDVDVVFVVEPAEIADEDSAVLVGTRLAASMMQVCSSHTAAGSIWEVDAALRPEGRSGALVRTLASHVGYYERWAHTWEFQALLKARPAAGDLELGAAYVNAVAPFVWAASSRPHFVEDVQAMRRRVEAAIPAKDVERQLKLGPGGLRDVEFAVQLLQLVHGRSDAMVRQAGTLQALEALATWGYVGRSDASSLANAYRFLRTMEHRIQLYRLRRTHIVPDDPADLRRLGRSLGFRSEPVAELVTTWRRHAIEVRRLHEKLFYRPLLNSVARLDPGDARLTPAAALDRLQALGYHDPANALRHLESLTSGVSRRAAIQRTLLPVLLGWFADSPDPDAGLLGFRQVSDALGSTHWYLRLLRDESAAAQRMAKVLASSKYCTWMLLRAPDAVMLFADDAGLVPRTVEELTTEINAGAERNSDPEAVIDNVRSIRRRELLRISVADLLGDVDVESVGEALTDVTTAALRAATDVAVRNVAVRYGGELPTRFAVVAMGRYGGRELGYGSDADVMFVHDPLDGASELDATTAAFSVANELRTLLMRPSPDPPLEIDADLRPEGRQGPLVRTLASYAAYYQRWSAPWESQALLRAEVVVGDTGLAANFCALIDPLRYPTAGVTDAAAREMRRLKARMESERLPRGADSTLHMKLGRGGLSDVEWTAQFLQLKHAARVPDLRTTRTVPALRAAVAADLLAAADAEVLLNAWRMALRVRNAVLLARGKPAELVPTDVRELAATAYVLGYPPGVGGDLIEDYRRLTRRARNVVERVFYG
jgi:glutamate-ammonia-ligase adenylyltransferase